MYSKPDPIIEKVHTNRKSTRGRSVYYQIVYKDNAPVKTIKHIRQSKTKIRTSKGMAVAAMLKYRVTKPSIATAKRKLERNNFELIWESSTKGTFYGNTKDLY